MTLRDAPSRSRRARLRRAGCASLRARAGSRRTRTRTSSRPGSSRTRASARGARRAWTQPIAPTSPATAAAISSLGRATTATFGATCSNAPSRFAAQPVDVDAFVRPRGARDRLARLRDGLVRHAARVHDRDVARARRTSAWPSREQALATACASANDTLQPRNRTEKVAIEGTSLVPLARKRRPPSPRARAARPAPSPAPRRSSARYPEVTATVAGRSRRGAPRRREARCSRRRRPPPGARRASTSPRRRRRRRRSGAPCRAATSTATGSRSSATTGANPSRAAATATTPEPQPASSRLPRSSRDEQLDARSRRRMRAGAERAAGVDDDGGLAGRRRLQGGPIQSPPARTGRWNSLQRSSQPGGDRLATTRPANASRTSPRPASSV